MQVMLEAKNIHKKFGKTQVLKGVDFRVEKGQVIAVIGPSGSGKSTLLRCLNNLETINDGTIVLDGEYIAKDGKYPKDKEVKRICSKMGMVFQNFNLFPHETVMQNLIEAPLIVKKESRNIAISRAKKLLAEVGLGQKEDNFPSQLSGGQQQRVAIARALAMEPEIMLFDEPTSALDPELTGEVLNVMKKLAMEHMTMVIVTHEIEFARSVADKVVFMDDGITVEQGNAKDVIDNPQNERTKSFLSRILE